MNYIVSIIGLIASIIVIGLTIKKTKEDRLNRTIDLCNKGAGLDRLYPLARLNNKQFYIITIHTTKSISILCVVCISNSSYRTT